MRDMNGTVTLSFVEEDNKQRVIFRVIPLCTKEGMVFHGTAEDFPDEGSLRIVPDKREQSTFKDRMRNLGGLCVIHLASEGKELVKVRQNRNYAPEQGEKNQNAIYSDVICEFMEDSCFEVVENAKDAANALTSKVLFFRDKMLCGPVDAQQAATVDLSTLKPFGNDSFLLHTIETEGLGRHRIYWNPEATLNWRQRRTGIRRKDHNSEHSEEASVTTAKPAPVAVKPVSAPKAVEEKTEAPKMRKEKPAKPERTEKPAHPQKGKPVQDDEKSTRRTEQVAAVVDSEKTVAKFEKTEKTPRAEKPARDFKREAKEKESAQTGKTAEQSLPIGTKLEILDSAESFDQQISRLAQPVSDSANRLSDQPAEAETEDFEQIARFTGTPVFPVSGKQMSIRSRTENVHHVVDQQLRGQRDEVMGTELGTGSYPMVENPIETLLNAFDYVWQNEDLRTQAMESLLHNSAFREDMTDALRRGGLNMHAAAAAQEQLAEIEAERISLIMQLETAKSNEKKYREELINSVVKKRKDESEKLKNEIRQLEVQREKLLEANRTLSEETAKQTAAFLISHVVSIGSVEKDRVLVSPVLGKKYSAADLAEALRVHMNESGFSISDDDAMILFICFALYDTFCVKADSMADAQLFASVILASFGLQSVSATVNANTSTEVASLLDESLNRTPTVTVQPVDTPRLTVFGHTTIYVAASDRPSASEDELLPYPVIYAPPMLHRALAHTAQWDSMLPSALSSFKEIRTESRPLLIEAEKWLNDLKQALLSEKIDLSATAFATIQRFLEIASSKVKGGFLAAADAAVAQWVVPAVLAHHVDPSKLQSFFVGLPRTMELLGIN